MRRLRFCGKQGDGSCILESDLHTNLIGEARGVASSNYEPDASDTVDRHAHEPRDGHDLKVLKDSYGPCTDWERHVAPVCGASAFWHNLK